MRYVCWTCYKSVSSELPDDSVIRALLICPECIQNKKIIFPEDIVPLAPDSGDLPTLESGTKES